MSSIAQTHPFVVGVDTHARNHVIAIIETVTGRLIATNSFPTTRARLASAIAWVARLTGADLAVLWVIEGCATYGANFARLVTGGGYQVIEAPRYDTAGRGGAVGKTDRLDAERIARATLALDDQQVRHPRDGQGQRVALRVLTTARDAMSREHTAAINALTALLRAFDLDVDARKALTVTQIKQVAKWRGRRECFDLATARTEAIRLAKQITTLAADLAKNSKAIEKALATTPATGLTEKVGFGPVTAAIVYQAWSHPGRLHSEAAFAALAGVNPIPASSGNTTRHRLNRGGDRQLNRALHTVALTRMRIDPATKAYVEKRRAQGLSDREIRRLLKRYIARQAYRHLNNASRGEPALQPAAAAHVRPTGAQTNTVAPEGRVLERRRRVPTHHQQHPTNTHKTATT